jgi:hypothetical protein
MQIVSRAPFVRIRRLVRRGYETRRWPKPIWRLRGFAELPVGDQTFKFCDAGRSPQHGWAGRVHRERWEAEVIELFSKAVRPGDIVFGVGAYVGPYTLLASRLAGPSGHVFAFEPDPFARAILERNVEANQALNVSVMPYAVGARERPGHSLTTSLATRRLASPLWLMLRARVCRSSVCTRSVGGGTFDRTSSRSTSKGPKRSAGGRCARASGWSSFRIHGNPRTRAPGARKQRRDVGGPPDVSRRRTDRDRRPSTRQQEHRDHAGRRAACEPQ